MGSCGCDKSPLWDRRLQGTLLEQAKSRPHQEDGYFVLTLQRKHVLRSVRGKIRGPWVTNSIHSQRELTTYRNFSLKKHCLS